MKLSYAFVCMGLVLSAIPVLNANPEALEEKVARWVETQNTLSKEKADWSIERDLILQMRDLLKAELDTITEGIEEALAETSDSTKVLAELQEKNDALRDSTQVLSDAMSAMEKSVISLSKAFPEPLLDKVAPLLKRIPQEGSEAVDKLSLSQRLQSVVGIISQAEKFNTTATIVGETREVETGKRVQVWTLYWGLAAAYFVDAQEQYSGYGRPTADGWKWETRNAMADEVHDLIDVKEGTAEPKFVVIEATLD